jgi:hypothetical protein
MLNPNGASAGLGGALDDGNGGGGGSARRRNDGARVPALGAVYGLRHWAQQGQGEEARLTEGLWRPETRRREEDDDDRRRRGSGSRGKGDAEVAGPSGLRGSIQGAPAEATRGLRGLAVHRRQAIAAAAVLTCRGIFGEIPTEERAEVAGERSWSSWVMR